MNSKSKPSLPSLPPPFSIGFPDRFTSYRREQVQAILDVTNSDKRVRVVAAPTGIGKSLIGTSIVVLEQARGLILTSTKILQSQYLRDAASLGMVDIRGASNYRCPALEPGGEYAHLRGPHAATADRGPCNAGLPCSLRTGGCPRFDAQAAAKASSLVVSNYDWWLAGGKKMRAEGAEETAGEFDYLVLDEMHSAADHVAKTMHIDLEVGNVRGLLHLEPLSVSATVDEWREWAKVARGRVAQELDAMVLELKVATDDGNLHRDLLSDITELRALDRVFDDMSQMYGRWVVEKVQSGRYITFDPVWVDRYTEARLFRGIPNVLGMSATAVPSEMKYLGVDEGKFDFFEYDSPFPVNRRPVYQWPVVRMHWKMSRSDMIRAVRAGDFLMNQRQDRKGIIHAVSYKRAREIQELSKFGSSFVMHDPRNTNEAVERFKHLPPPAVLDSPSVATGYDFPFEECEYVWIPKTPYPSTESAVMRAKMETDKTFMSFYAAKEVVQMSGRHVRDVEDKGETIITDAAFGGLLKHTKLFPKWWLQARRYTSDAPPPMSKLMRRR